MHINDIVSRAHKRALAIRRCFVSRDTNTLLRAYIVYTVSQKKLGHFYTTYNFRNIEQIFTKFGTNQSLFILNIVPGFI